MRVFLIEDDLPIAENLKTVLESEGIRVFHFSEGQAALSRLKHESPDAVLLDLMLPDIPGEQVVKEIRKTCEIPIIVISAKNTEFDKVLLLELGVDDYLTKPFSIKELIARLKRNVEKYRRVQEKEHGTVLSAGPFELDLENFTFKVDGKQVQLTPKEFKIMEIFLSNPNRILTRSQIEDAVWEEGYITPKNLDVYIARLRSKIGKRASALKNVRGFGFKLEV